MKVVNISDEPQINNPVVTIGIFDGVHKGHRYILNKLIDRTRETGGESVVISLWPHPRIVLDKDLWDFRLLHTQDEKVHHLSTLGLDYYIVIPFDKSLASMSACGFVDQYLVNKLNVKRLILGYDNSFGKDRQGNPNGLAACARKSGLVVEKLNEFRISEENISSTSIRHALLDGNLPQARNMLEYDYYLKGEVIMGNQLGRKIGYPTANINPQSPYKLIPKDGVYAILLEYNGKKFKGMLNIGVRPTLGSPNPVKIIEAHLFDTNIDLYGKEVTIYFINRIRDEKKFNGLDALQQQLKQDELIIRELFAGIN